MKILIIAQHLFPIKTPRAHRTTELVKEFSRKGHEVVLYAVLGKYDYSVFEKKYNVVVKNIPIHMQVRPYTSDGPGNRVLVDKVLGRLFGKLLEFPYIEFIYSIPAIIKSETQYDLLISIADPHHIHWGCARAKKLYPEQFPSMWIADCGDPFMINGNSKEHFKYFGRFEKKFCTSCDYITVPISEASGGYYPEFSPKIRVIPQGFDFEMPPEQMVDPGNKILTFAYAGTFYKDIRNPDKFLNYLAQQKIDFKFLVFTSHPNLVLPYKKLFGDRLEIKNPLERTELIKVLEKMDFLLNIENFNSPAQVPSKLIDYAIANRPILSINPVHLDTDLIDKFMLKNYLSRHIVNNLKQYQIEEVVKNFIDLAERKE